MHNYLIHFIINHIFLSFCLLVTIWWVIGRAINIFINTIGEGWIGELYKNEPRGFTLLELLIYADLYHNETGLETGATILWPITIGCFIIVVLIGRIPQLITYLSNLKFLNSPRVNRIKLTCSNFVVRAKNCLNNLFNKPIIKL